MKFRLANTFTDSLVKLTGEEQKAVKVTTVDLQLNPANPGLKFHKLDKAKDKNFWSVRVSRDIRLIVHKTQDDLLLCYVDHHDAAYRWAELRKLETHPKTGAAQIVEIRETVQEVFVPVYVEQEEVAAGKQLIFDAYTDDQLLSYGVPEEWLTDVKQANEDSILELADHLPEEASEALLELATGGTPRLAFTSQETDTVDPFAHPDAQRRFRVMSNLEELEQALEFPWDKWTIFLHPAQREIVEKKYSGPVRVSGTAGTGKTIVALHRAVYLARKNSNARILLTTFSEALAQALRIKLRRLVSNQPSLSERIDVESMEGVGRRLYERNVGTLNQVDKDALLNFFMQAKEKFTEVTYGIEFLVAEWDEVVDAWQIETWEGYRDVKRLGRKSRLSEAKRAQLWKLFDYVRESLKADGLVTRHALYSQVANAIVKLKHPPYDHAIVDEAQDISVAQLRMLAAIRSDQSDSLFFAGDLGQRIFQQPFSWSRLGVNIRGRSSTLRVNYRTSHQIRLQADKLLDPEISDMDGNIEKRTNTVSVFNGPVPMIKTYGSTDEESEAVSNQIKQWLSEDLVANEIGIFVRSEKELPRAQAAVEAAGQESQMLSDTYETKAGCIHVSTMHLAKGLEYRAVVVMACDDEVIPSQDRIEAIGDTADLEDVYNTERYLLYVACTRARDNLMVTSVDPFSEFLDDLISQ